MTSPFDTTHIKRRTVRYEQHLKQHNYIKPNKISKDKGTPAFVSVISVIIISFSEEARKWFANQEVEIILIQEHRMLSQKAFGRIPGYSLVFSPARRTMLNSMG